MISLDDYQISAAHGFLPSQPPLQQLPSYYEAWESICSNLHALRVNRVLEDEVSRMPMLGTEFLVSERQWRRAYVLLGYITNAYIWGAERPLEVLPAKVAVPFVAVARYLGMPPLATYAAENLWNYKHIDPTQSIENPDNFSALTTFSGLIDESWFYSIPAAIEARGAPIVVVTLQAIDAVSSNNSNDVVVYLREISDHIAALTAILPRMYEKCDPDIFFNKIRPFLSGTTSAQLPKGIFFEKADGQGEYKVLQGPTAAQSPLFHFLDIALGIRHRSTGSADDNNGARNASPDEDEFLMRMREHMPRDHRRFLEDVAKIANIRGYVLSQSHTPALHEAYNICLQQLAAYRSKHVQIVSRYIVVPSRAADRASLQETKPGSAGRNLASDHVPNKEAALGTGGTAPIQFLKQVRDETKEGLLTME